MATPQTLLPRTGTQYQGGTEDFGFDTPLLLDIYTTQNTAATPVGCEDFGFDDVLPDQHWHGIGDFIVRTPFFHQLSYSNLHSYYGLSPDPTPLSYRDTILARN